MGVPIARNKYLFFISVCCFTASIWSHKSRPFHFEFLSSFDPFVGSVVIISPAALFGRKANS